MPVDQKILNALMESWIDVTDLTFKGILYGDPGAGKTVLGATIGKKILFIAADPDGWESLINHPELGLGTRIKVMDYKGVSQLESISDAIVDGAKMFKEFDTVNVDTLSHVSGMDLDLVMKAKIEQKGYSSGEKSLKTMKFDPERDMYGVYNQNAARMKGAVYKLFKTNLNVVATAHSYSRKLRATDTERFEPGFPPAILSAISANASMIAYMTANEGGGLDSDGSVKYARQIQYHPTRTIVAKTRIGGLPITQNNPDLKKIVEDWLARGAKLLSHEEAEEIQDGDGLAPPKTDAEPLTEFGI